jgi:hypothetical protein
MRLCFVNKTNKYFNNVKIMTFGRGSVIITSEMSLAFIFNDYMQVDYVSGMPLEKLREKYCGHWMTPFPHLKFVSQIMIFY